MKILTEIDQTKPVSFYACQKVEVTDPELKKFSPFVDTPVDGAEVKIEPIHVPQLMAVISSPEWNQIFGKDMQCISNDQDGNPILSTWFSFDVFKNFVNAITDLPIHLTLSSALLDWEPKGELWIWFDGYRLR